MLISVVPALCLALGPMTAEVDPLPFDPAAWRGMARVEVRVRERDRSVTYSGVPLRVVLEGKLKGEDAGRMSALRSLADAVLLVRAADGYQCAVSAAEVAMDERGEKFLIALDRDGRALGTDQGPAKLIVPGDPERVRWVRMVTGVDLVRLPRGRRAR